MYFWFGSMRVLKSSSDGFGFFRFDKFRVFGTLGFKKLIGFGSGSGLDPALLKLIFSFYLCVGSLPVDRLSILALVTSEFCVALTEATAFLKADISCRLPVL